MREFFLRLYRGWWPFRGAKRDFGAVCLEGIAMIFKGIPECAVAAPAAVSERKFGLGWGKKWYFLIGQSDIE